MSLASDAKARRESGFGRLTEKMTPTPQHLMRRKETKQRRRRR